MKKTILFFVLAGLTFILFSYSKSKKELMLSKQLKELESYIIYRDSLNIKVSEVPVAWHIDHAIITINKIHKALDTSNVNNYKKQFNFGRFMMFTMNKIPRGKAESPNIVRPEKIIITDSIFSHLNRAHQNIDRFKNLSKKAHFTHPYIGMLNKKQAKKFLLIHTEHHLKIIRDILVK